MYIAKQNKGFTLIELSIVIVVIGLIVAGVVGGQTLVKQAKIRLQIADLQKYNVAYNTFLLEYDDIPGDFNKASQYWPGTPDGDNNGVISNSSYNDCANLANENVKFFLHLSQAGLINENYTNIWQIGVGYPFLKLDTTKGMCVASHIRPGGSGVNFQLYGNDLTKRYTAAIFLNISAPTNASDYDEDLGTATPKTYSIIDNKIDDGIAREGVFMAYRPHGSTIGDCLDSRGGDYLITNEFSSCHSMYVLSK